MVMLCELEHLVTILLKSGLTVCLWHKADIAAVLINVCFWG
jgi:hypothetical protein